MVYQQQGDKDKARAILEQGVKENAGDYRAYNALARFDTNSGEQDKALANIVKSLELEVNQQEAYAVLSDLFQGKWDELINQADSIASSKTAAMLKFYAYYADQKYVQAISQYKDSLEQDKNNLKARVLAAICMLKNGEKEKADQTINKLAKEKTNEWIMADIAGYYQGVGDESSFQKWAAKVFQQGNRYPDILLLMADLNKNNATGRLYAVQFLLYHWKPLVVIQEDLEAHSIKLLPEAISRKVETIISSIDNTPQKRPEPVPWANATRKFSFRAHVGITHLAFSPDGKTLVTGGADGQIKTWDVASGQNLLKISGGGFVAVSPDGKVLASASYLDEDIILWDAATGQKLKTFSENGLVNSIAFSPDGKTLASGSRSLKTDISIWDVASGKIVKSWDDPNGAGAITFFPDGRTLATLSNYYSCVILWDVTSGSELKRLIGHNDRISSIAFSPDRKTIAAGSSDGNVKLWDVASGQELKTLIRMQNYGVEVLFRGPGGGKS
ncbi:MAG: tetratricopeptide repeat protein, partial [Bacillota bacterium]|nr:tetratricopeptide repeat protein [Bacillota bacterium]